MVTQLQHPCKLLRAGRCCAVAELFEMMCNEPESLTLDELADVLVERDGAAFAQVWPSCDALPPSTSTASAAEAAPCVADHADVIVSSSVCQVVTTPGATCWAVPVWRELQPL